MAAPGNQSQVFEGLLLADSTRLPTSASNIETRSQADSCTHRPRVKPDPASDDNSQGVTG